MSLQQPNLTNETLPPLHRSRLSEIDALRGIAALFVLCFHYSLNGRPTYPIFRFGITGVDLFFLISGFVIMMSMERIKYGYEFIISRFCRLFPTYWTCVTLALIIILSCKPYYGHQFIIPWAQYFANMTMFQHYLGYEDLDGPYWTMIIEMLFYMLMLLLFYVRAIKSVVFFLTFMVLAMTGLTEKFNGDSITHNILHFFPLMQFLPLFLAGILFYKVYNQEKKSKFYILLIIGCYFCQILLYKFGGRSYGHVSHPEYKLIVAIYFAFLFLLLFRKLKFIVNRYTLFLGKISFALYLIHQYLSINCIIPILVDNGVNFYIAAYAIAFPVSLLVAAGITFYVEVPAARWLKPRLYAFAHFLIAIRKKVEAVFTRKKHITEN